MSEGDEGESDEEGEEDEDEGESDEEGEEGEEQAPTPQAAGKAGKVVLILL
jgi:hypothetical protein